MLKIQIYNGNSFRNLFQQLYMTISFINLCCSEELSIKQHNIDNTLIHHIIFNKDTISYKYTGVNELQIGLKLSDITKALKLISKRDTIVLEMEDVNSPLKISAIGANNIENCTYIVPQDIEIFEYELPKITKEIYTTLSIELSKQIISLLACKPHNITMKLHENGISLESSDTIKKIIQMGDISDELNDINVDTTLLKALSKIPNLSYSRSIVKFYHSTGCLAIKIPYILGEYVMYVRT